MAAKQVVVYDPKELSALMFQSTAEINAALSKPATLPGGHHPYFIDIEQIAKSLARMGEVFAALSESVAAIRKEVDRRNAEHKSAAAEAKAQKPN